MEIKIKRKSLKLNKNVSILCTTDIEMQQINMTVGELKKLLGTLSDELEVFVYCTEKYALEAKHVHTPPIEDNNSYFYDKIVISNM